MKKIKFWLVLFITFFVMLITFTMGLFNLPYSHEGYDNFMYWGNYVSFLGIGFFIILLFLTIWSSIMLVKSYRYGGIIVREKDDK